MKCIKKVVTAFGGICVAALLVAALAPKATRGIVAALVEVANTPANPVPNQDVDNPDRATVVNIGCQAQSSSLPFGGIITCNLGFGTSTAATYTVPAGQRLVMEQFDSLCSSPKGTSFSQGAALLYNSAPGFPLTSNIVVSPNGNSNYPIRYYAGPGSQIQVAITSSDTTGNTLCTVNVGGHLVNLP